ncbi:MAG: hypothetical protein HZA82_06640 [Thaumarchaeota archaeon]|nr:hypothetical protein [Nitrososphaerota archaeon]
MKFKLFGILIVLVLIPQYAFGSGDIMYGLGTVNDLTSDGTNVYYFETDKDMKSATWIPDTTVKVNNGIDTRNLLGKQFIYPTDIKQDKEHLYFAALSENCIGQILCNYQDLFKVSKKDGTVSVLAKDLRSLVHLSVDNDLLYVSESNGKVWKIDQDGTKSLVFQTNNIVMDVVSEDSVTYWIEEISDQNSTVLRIDDNMSPKIIAENLHIPYDLIISEKTLYWNEIYVKPVSGAFSEFTLIKSGKNDKTQTLMEFQNTSPIAQGLGTPHYGPYLIIKDYLILVNNTHSQSVIQMINLHNKTAYDVYASLNYDVKYLRNDNNFVYAIGKNPDGFVIGKYALPVAVPEFPSGIMIVSVALFSIVILQRFWRS